MTAIARALWFVWDGAEGAVLGRSDTRVIEVTQRVPDCEVFVVTTLTGTGEAGELLDFFWVRRQRAFMRPLVLPHDARGVEVAALAGGRRETIARYHFDPAQDRNAMLCDIVFAQVPRGQPESGQAGLVARQQSVRFADAQGRLSALQRNPAHTLVWAAASPFEDVGTGGVMERRVGPLSALFPRLADLIKVTPMRYRKEKEEVGATKGQVDESEAAIRSVARELRNIISLEIDAPLTEMSDPNAVPGVVIFHYMKQRELLQLWQREASVLSFTVADLEELDGQSSPFAPTGKVFVPRPLRVQENNVEGLRISARDHRSSNGPVRRFTVDFAFAVLGDLLIVYHTVEEGLAGEDGALHRTLTFRVGPERIEYLDADLRSDDDEEMIKAALEVVEASFATTHRTDSENPSQALARFVAEWARGSSLDEEDFARGPLLPLFAIAYAAHGRYAPTVAARIDFLAFKQDPGVLSAAFLTPDSHAAGPDQRPFGDATRLFSMRLASQVGASDLIMPPAALDADIQAADRLTSPRYSELWENAVNVGVRIDIGRTDADALVRRLKAFRGWRDNPDIDDELANTPDQEIRDAFQAYRQNDPPYRQPLDGPDFERLFALVEELATKVEQARTIIGGAPTTGPAPARDERTTEKLKNDLAKLIKEALLNADPRIRAVAKRHADANYTLRKQMRDAEKELKGLIPPPAISGEILALIDRLETWAAIDRAPTAGPQSPTDRRQRILDLSRALRRKSQLVEMLPTTQLGRAMAPLVKLVEEECSRFRLDAAAEDGDILSSLPNYARFLGFHVAHRALVAARANGNDVPATPSRLLALWPERANDCWDQHMRWAATHGSAVTDVLTKPWRLQFSSNDNGLDDGRDAEPAPPTAAKNQPRNRRGTRQDTP